MPIIAKEMKGLTLQQHAAIEALMTESRVGDAARKAGVSREAIRLWLKDESFRNALREITNETFGQLSRNMADLALTAKDHLADIMENPATPGSGIRRAAANDVLAHATKLRELIGLEDRITDLEARLADGEPLEGNDDESLIAIEAA